MQTINCYFSCSDSASQVLPVFLRDYLLLSYIDAQNLKTFPKNQTFFSLFL